jgi:hypothetical protein
MDTPFIDPWQQISQPAEQSAEGQLAPVINLAAIRRQKQPGAQGLTVSENALARHNDYARQVALHEGRQISPWEAWAIVHDPAQLGLGHGPVASRALNPAV